MSLEMNAEDQAKVEYDAQKISDETMRLAIAYGHVFRGPAGQIVYKHLSLLCNAEAGVVRNINNPDPNSVMFEAGKLAVINWIKYMIKVDDGRRTSK